jgi:LAS superfamily LD-carboxypeptidase LdcB
VIRLQYWLAPYAEALLSYFPQRRVTSTYRSYSEQYMLYRRYLLGYSKYPAAPPGRSMHNYGRAFDVDDADPDELALMGATWENWGGRWGGRFGDPIHFEA